MQADSWMSTQGGCRQQRQMGQGCSGGLETHIAALGDGYCYRILQRKRQQRRLPFLASTGVANQPPNLHHPQGPDHEGRLWLMIDNREAINASRTHGADVVARVVVSNVRALVALFMEGSMAGRRLLWRLCVAHTRLHVRTRPPHQPTLSLPKKRWSTACAC